jgi:hypothetical protein
MLHGVGSDTVRRMRFPWVVFVLLVACTPSPDAVCTHLEELDQAAPVETQSDGVRMPRMGRQPNQKASCLRQLDALQSVDSKAYATCAKCVMKAKTWTDGWDCWVLDHHSPKQTREIATLIKCDSSCDDEKKKCDDACAASADSCRDTCARARDKCATACQFP